MSRQSKKTVSSENRRKFLKGLAVGGGAVAVVTAGSTVAAVVEPESKTEAKGSSGYQETAHVHAYYKSARV